MQRADDSSYMTAYSSAPWHYRLIIFFCPFLAQLTAGDVDICAAAPVLIRKQSDLTLCKSITLCHSVLTCDMFYIHVNIETRIKTTRSFFFIYQNTLTNFQSGLVAFSFSAAHDSFSGLCYSRQETQDLCWGSCHCESLHPCLLFEGFPLNDLCKKKKNK